MADRKVTLSVGQIVQGGLTILVGAILVTFFLTRDSDPADLPGINDTGGSSETGDSAVSESPSDPETVRMGGGGFPETAEDAAEFFGVENASQFQKVGCCGWTTSRSVRLRLEAGLCVDFDLNADPAETIEGQTEFIDNNGQFQRTLMASDGSILGGATVYWSTCNRL